MPTAPMQRDSIAFNDPPTILSRSSLSEESLRTNNNPEISTILAREAHPRGFEVIDPNERILKFCGMAIARVMRKDRTMAAYAARRYTFDDLFFPLFKLFAESFASVVRSLITEAPSSKSTTFFQPLNNA